MHAGLRSLNLQTAGEAAVYCALSAAASAPCRDTVTQVSLIRPDGAPDGRWRDGTAAPYVLGPLPALQALESVQLPLPQRDPSGRLGRVLRSLPRCEAVTLMATNQPCRAVRWHAMCTPCMCRWYAHGPVGGCFARDLCLVPDALIGTG